MVEPRTRSELAVGQHTCVLAWPHAATLAVVVLLVLGPPAHCMICMVPARTREGGSTKGSTCGSCGQNHRQARSRARPGGASPSGSQ